MIHETPQSLTISMGDQIEREPNQGLPLWVGGNKRGSIDFGGYRECRLGCIIHGKIYTTATIYSLESSHTDCNLLCTNSYTV